MGELPGDPGGPSVLTRVLKTTEPVLAVVRSKGGDSETCVRLPLKVEDRPRAGDLGASISWKRPGKWFSPGASRRNVVLPTPGVSPRRPTP